MEKEEAARKAEEEARKRALALEEQKRKELLEKERELAKQTSIEAKKQVIRALTGVLVFACVLFKFYFPDRKAILTDFF